MRAFTGSLLLPILFMLVSVFCRDMSLVPRGEFFHDRNQHPSIFRLHSISLLFLPQHCHSFLLSSPQHCSLVFTYRLIQSNKLQLYSLQPLCFFSALHHSVAASTDAVSPLTCGLMTTSRWAQKNQMQHKELKGHKSFSCWQGGDVSKSHHGKMVAL